MRLIREVEADNSNFSAQAKTLTSPGSDYTFVLDRSGLYFVKTYFNFLSENYTKLSSEVYVDVSYSQSFNILFVFSQVDKKIDLFSFNEGTDFFGKKLASITDVFGVDYIEFNDNSRSLYVGNKSEQIITEYSVPYIPYYKIYYQLAYDAAIVGSTCYLVDGDKLKKVDIISKETEDLKSYNGNPFLLKAITFDNDIRLYIADSDNLGFEEYLVATNTSIFYAGDLYDPIDIFIGRNNQIVVIFNVGEQLGDGGAAYFFTAQDDPSVNSAVGATIQSELYQGLYSLAYDESRQFFYSTNNNTDLVLVSSTINGPDPLALISVGENPTSIIYNPVNKQILCLCNETEIYVIEDLVEVSRFVLPSTEITTINTDPISGLILAGDRSGEIFIVDPKGKHLGSIFPNVGEINNIIYFNIRGSEILAIGSEGITIVSAPRPADIEFSRDQKEKDLSLKVLPENNAETISLNAEYYAAGFNSGNIVIFSKNDDSIVGSYSHNTSILSSTSLDDYFIFVSTNEVTIIKKDATFSYNSTRILSGSWFIIIPGKVVYDSNSGEAKLLEILLVDNNYLLKITFDLDQNNPQITEQQQNINDILEGDIEFTLGTYIPKSDNIPSNISLRESFALRRVNPNFTGVVLEIYNNNGNLAKFSFKEDGRLDEEAIIQHVELGSGIEPGRGYVSKIAGQYRNYDLIQDDPNNRPIIAFGSELFKTDEGEITIKFTGDGDYLKISNSPGLNLSDTLKISGQFKFDSTGGNFQTLISKGNYTIQENDNTLRWETRAGLALDWADFGELGENPEALAIYKNQVYAFCSGSSEVYQFDSVIWRLSANSENKNTEDTEDEDTRNIGTIGSFPISGGVFNDELFIACQGNDKIYKFDETAYSKAGGFKGETIGGIYPFNNRLYVSSKDTGELYYIDENENWFLVDINSFGD